MMMRKISTRTRQVHTLIISSKETIKPSSPTPPHLKTYNLSPLDQFCPSVYCPIILFYPNNTTTITSLHDQEKARSTLLKKSLSQTLTQYYPFSGRINNEEAYDVDCNDEGVEFTEARIDTPLSESIHVHENGYQPLCEFFPMGMGGWAHHHRNSWTSLVMIQLTHFSCGGMALAVSISHKLADARTLGNFISHWAAIARQQVQVWPPHFLSSSNSNVVNGIQVREFVLDRGNNTVTKKFVFPNSKISQLKDEIRVRMNNNNNNHPPPSRIEVVTSVLHGCAVRAAKKGNNNNFKAFLLAQVMNLRSRMADPLPETTVGNVHWSVYVPTVGEEELELSSLVGRIKKAKTQLTKVTDSQICVWLNQIGEASKNFVVDNDVGVFSYTSTCGFQLYEIDFGWGKPVRVTIDGCPMKNAFVLMDTPAGDGIEALVALEQQDMDLFQKDPQLLASKSRL